MSEKHGLPFPILADPTKATAKKYGVLKKFFGTLELAQRETFLIDPQGRIVKRYIDVDPKGHSQSRAEGHQGAAGEAGGLSRF